MKKTYKKSNEINLHTAQIQEMDRLIQKAEELKKQGIYIQPFQVKRHLAKEIVSQKMKDYNGKNPKKFKAILEIITQAEIEKEYPNYNSDGNKAKIDYWYDFNIMIGEPDGVNIKVLARRIFENAMSGYTDPSENYKKSKIGL